MYRQKSIKKQFIVTITISCFLSITANAQKLPNKQEVSLRAPSNIKIDGNATEWDNKFQAYNKSTNIYYTIANSTENLYLIVKATDPAIITKIVLGGITLNIGEFSKTKNIVAVTYPAYDKNNKPLYLILDNKPALTGDPIRNKMQTDSFVNARNKQLTDKLKIIELSNVKVIDKDQISIYNNYGIKADSHFNGKMDYIYTLVIPLKYLSTDTEAASKFRYNIKLNGAIPKGGQLLNVGRPDIISYLGADGISYNIGNATPENMILAYPTDFWGEYTLAKK